MASRTAVVASTVTWGELLTTRLTVDRETPATAATCSSVGAPGAGVIVAPFREDSRGRHCPVLRDAPTECWGSRARGRASPGSPQGGRVPFLPCPECFAP